jgi:hypothetical protein
VLYFNKFIEYTDGEITKYYYLGDRLIATRFDSAATMAQLLAGRVLERPTYWAIPIEVALPGISLTLLLLVLSPIPTAARVRAGVTPCRAVGAMLTLLWGRSRWYSSRPSRRMRIGSGSRARFGTTTRTTAARRSRSATTREISNTRSVTAPMATCARAATASIRS